LHYCRSSGWIYSSIAGSQDEPGSSDQVQVKLCQLHY
jgi:hypothetical protein